MPIIALSELIPIADTVWTRVGRGNDEQVKYYDYLSQATKILQQSVINYDAVLLCIIQSSRIFSQIFLQNSTHTIHVGEIINK